MIRKPVKWFEFADPDGNRWSVFLTLRKLTRMLQVDKDGGPYAGRCLFGRRLIYVDASIGKDAIFETTLHELAHVAMRPLALPEKLDEEIVEQTSSKLNPILQKIVVWPAFPAVIQTYLEKGQCT